MLMKAYLLLVLGVVVLSVVLDVENFHQELLDSHELYESCWEERPLQEGLEFLANETIQLDIVRPTYGSTLLAEDLIIEVEATIFRGFFNPEKIEDGGWWAGVRVCLQIDGRWRLCGPPGEMRGVRAEGLPPGPHHLRAWTEDGQGTRIDCNVQPVSSLFILASDPIELECLADEEKYVSGGGGAGRRRGGGGGGGSWARVAAPPPNATVAPGGDLALDVLVGYPDCPDEYDAERQEETTCSIHICVQFDNEGPVFRFPLGRYGPGGGGAGGEAAAAAVPLGLGAPPPGEHVLALWAEARTAAGTPLPIGCRAQHRFFVRHVPEAFHRDRLIVTAANDPYFPRLENLVGSILFWEPETQIRVYDLGLSPGRRAEAEAWGRGARGQVAVADLPWAALPAHYREPGLVAYKPWALLDGLRTHRDVLWLDANFEVRRPLTEAWRVLGAAAGGPGGGGHFLTVCGRLFPAPTNVRPATLARFGCPARPAARRPEATSAALGARRGGWAHRALLLPWEACCAERDCIWPPGPGTTFHNQRRDQSILNAVLCRHANTTLHTATRWYMWGDQRTFRPPGEQRRQQQGPARGSLLEVAGTWEGGGGGEEAEREGGRFSEMVLFSRRNDSHRPYANHARQAAAAAAMMQQPQ